MRPLPLLIILAACGVSASVAPDASTATGLSAIRMTAPDADDSEHQALQRQAELALDVLREARERRLALAQLAAN